MPTRRIEHDSGKNAASPEKDRVSRLKKALRANLRLRKNGTGNNAEAGGDAGMLRRERPVPKGPEPDEG